MRLWGIPLGVKDFLGCVAFVVVESELVDKQMYVSVLRKEPICFVMRGTLDGRGFGEKGLDWLGYENEVVRLRGVSSSERAE